MSGSKYNKYTQELLEVDTAYKHHTVDKETALKRLANKYDT